MLIALSFAEVASRFEGTGGPYLYTRAAFGRFAAFEVGWMLWFTRAASWAAVITVLIAALGRYWPRVTSGAPKIVLLTSIVAVLAAINIRGIRQSSFVVNALTVGKLLPLVVFIVVGLFYVDASRLTADASVPLASLSASGLLLIFAFGGYEVVPVVAGETRDPPAHGPVRAHHDDRHRHDRDDDGAGRRAGDAARAGRSRRRRWPTPRRCSSALRARRC